MRRWAVLAVLLALLVTQTGCALVGAAIYRDQKMAREAGVID